MTGTVPVQIPVHKHGVRKCTSCTGANEKLATGTTCPGKERTDALSVLGCELPSRRYRNGFHLQYGVASHTLNLSAPRPYPSPTLSYEGERESWGETEREGGGRREKEGRGRVKETNIRQDGGDSALFSQRWL